VLKGRRVVAGVLERLAECEFQGDALLPARSPELLAHGSDIGGLEAKGLEARQALVGAAAPRLLRERPAEHLDRASVLALFAQHVPEQQPGISQVGVSRDRSLRQRQRLPGASDELDAAYFEAQVIVVVRLRRQQPLEQR
jgi:hypothetical protein